MKIDITDLIKTVNSEFEALEKESVTVGILDGAFAALPDYKQHRKLPNDSSGMVVLRPKRKKSTLKLKDLARILDSNPLFRIFSDPKITENNKFARQVAEQFAVMDKTPTDIKRLENACRAMIRNPIYQAQYQAVNDPKYIKKKGITPYGIATGTLFTNIKARFNPS